jgi:hypothetical protein
MTAIFLGDGDLHEPEFDDMKVFVNLALHSHPEFTKTDNHCRYSMRIYPSKTFKDSYDSDTPEVFAAVVATTFVAIALVFFLYDLFVQKRNNNLIIKAARANTVVSSLFPEQIRDRLLVAPAGGKKDARQKNAFKNLDHDKHDQAESPLADLFLESTIIFADVSGFTAWSSTREPTQVFVLLETLFQAFDQIAKKRRIFKVETGMLSTLRLL